MKSRSRVLGGLGAFMVTGAFAVGGVLLGDQATQMSDAKRQQAADRAQILQDIQALDARMAEAEKGLRDVQQAQGSLSLSGLTNQEHLAGDVGALHADESALENRVETVETRLRQLSNCISGLQSGYRTFC